MSAPKPSICFWKRVISIKWRNKLLIHSMNLTGYRKSACCLRLLVLLEIWVIALFSIGGLKFFPRVAATMVSKRFVKLGIKVHFWILVKMIRILFKFIIYSSCERALRNERVKPKTVRKWSLNFTFGHGSCLILDISRSNLNIAVLVQVFLRFEIVIFNSNFEFCMMSYYCSMTRVAGWILTRKMIKRTIVFYPVCLKRSWRKLDKHLWRGLFCESWTITHHKLT